MLLCFPFALLILMLLLVWMFADIPSFEELENPDSKLATQVIAQDGEILTTFHIENRTFVSYEELSPHLIHAAIATEDARFYQHSGIDFVGLGRVFFKTLLLRNSSQGGGSTITQQLAKTLYPRADVSSKIPGWSKVRMVWIKLKEWITAVKLERDYTKEEIIDMYLNSIFFGSSAYGIRSASETFFAKLPMDLTVEESALLVGMVNKPTRYNPVINPDKSLARRNFVIGQMCKEGYITKAERDSIQQIPISLSYQVQDHNAGLAPYFRDMLRRTMNAHKPRRGDYVNREDFSRDSLLWETDDLYGWLNKNAKPDGTPYNLTVQLVGDNFEARAEEIRAMLDDPSTISFEKGTYTDQQLHEISAEITDAYLTEGSGVQSVGVGWGTNGGFGASGKEMRVVVRADEDRAIDLAQELGSKYGDAVIVESSEGKPELTDATDEATEEATEEAMEEAPADEQLISPAPDEAPEEPAHISEQTEARILEITFIAMGAATAVLIILARRRKRK